jgi:hypothetical protein
MAGRIEKFVRKPTPIWNALNKNFAKARQYGHHVRRIKLKQLEVRQNQVSSRSVYTQLIPCRGARPDLPVVDCLHWPCLSLMLIQVRCLSLSWIQVCCLIEIFIQVSCSIKSWICVLMLKLKVYMSGWPALKSFTTPGNPLELSCC